MAKLQKITPFLWFEKGAEDAAEYYVSVFKDSKIKRIQKYPKSAEEVSGQKAGSVMSVAARQLIGRPRPLLGTAAQRPVD